MDTFELEAHYKSIFLQEGLSGAQLEQAIRQAVGKSEQTAPSTNQTPTEPRKPEPTSTQPKLPF
jgi:hypothetical protein